ncbi:MAG: flagellar motor switch protein FliG [Candidatus Atribacteria bacterium]|jgi:flagellar motor switch protein FliG|nr:flagellar motor switch protein FliG [Candidatus Atribacteria bacterium]
MAIVPRRGLTGRQKAAILLVSLGPELSAPILKKLSENEIEDITLEIAALEKVPPEIREEVINEFYHMAVAQLYIAQGGVEYAKQLLEKALGPHKAQEIISKLSASLEVTPFESLRRADPLQILNFIQNEHPQTIALVLSYLKPEQSATILGNLPEGVRGEVAMRLALMDRASPEVVREIESILERKISTFLGQDLTRVAGKQKLIEILNKSDRGTEKSILEAIEEKDPDLAEQIRSEMFVFEDIALLDDRAIQLVLRQVDNKDLALALKGASEEVREKIFKNMSQRAAQMLKEDMEYMGPVRARLVNEAQQKIVNIVRRLEEAGEIVIARGGEEEIIV